MKKWISTLLLLFFISSNVFANSAAPYRLPNQSSIYFDSDSGVILYHESIEIALSDDLNRADYRVVYEFKNTHNKNLELPIWFLTNGYNEYSFDVWLDSKKIKTSKIDVDIDSIHNWSIDVSPNFVTPKNYKPIDMGMNYYHNYSQVNIEEFILTIHPDEITEVVVEYSANSGYIRKDEYFAQLNTQIYYLSPASFYEGDAKVDIDIIVPNNTLIGSNLPFDSSQDNVYRVSDYSIGTENLYLTFLNKNDLFLGTNSRMQYYKYLALIFIILIALTVYYRKKKRTKRLLIGLMVINILLIFARPTSGTIFMLIFLSPLIIIAVVAFLITIIYKHKKRLIKGDKL
ncbi:MAG: hypothetical protein U9Q80_10830 [Bacillota bacterium]|nr:hypothetical protein [Bacillota bacterium]